MTAPMVDSLIQWSGVSLEVVILLRGVLTGLLREYPLFHAYIGCVLLKEIIGILSLQFAPGFYEPLYWPAELATILASYAVIIEIFRQTFRRSPERLAQNLLRIMLFFTPIYTAFDLLRFYKAFGLLHGALIFVPRATIELGRDLRYIEGAILLVMLWLLVKCRVFVGRNLLGLILGYSFWVGLNVVNWAFLFQRGNEASLGWRRLYPITYVITLVIWCVSLWSRQPDPGAEATGAIERDYERPAAKTKAALAHLSGRAAWTLRP